jgi:hypothetical protein
MASPLLVDNRRCELSIQVGNNRAMAAVVLGWEALPSLVYGEYPATAQDSRPIDTLEQAQAYLRDGFIYPCDVRGYRMADVTPPETMIYPTSQDTYFDG